MGMKASDTAVLYLEDVRVPAVNVIGDPGMGFSYQMIQVRFGLNLSKLVQPFLNLNQIWLFNFLAYRVWENWKLFVRTIICKE